MNNLEPKELQQMAFAAELARQVVHDCSNLLYNLLLQLEITEKVVRQDASQWSGLKNEAKLLATRLQEWHQYGLGVAREKRKIDLNGLLRETITELFTEDKFVQPTSPDPMWLTSFASEVKCLCCFLMQTALQNGGAADSLRSIETEQKGETVVMRICGIQTVDSALRGLDGAPGADSEAERPSLLVAACKSIAIRLDAKIYLQKDDRGIAISVEFPVDLS